ncbi:MAG: hypothetical protein ACKOSR_10180 [Flavobacteriales bacterium]
MRLRLILFLMMVGFGFSAVHAAPADTSIVRATKDLGLYVGGAYSLIDMDASAYFVGDKTGVPELQNSPGMFGGFCYNFYAGKKSIIRPAIEACFLPATITYQTDIDYKTQQRIYPMTVELPFSWIYSAYRVKSFPAPKASPEFGVSLRPVLTVKPLNDVQPVLRTSNLNTDLFVGYPFNNGKSVMRLEVFFSYGWFNLIGTSSDDYRTYSIQWLQRHSAGIRLMFH